MLTDLFTSLHKLMRARKIVKWNWLPLLTSWYLLILKNWWAMAISGNNNVQHTQCIYKIDAMSVI